MTTTATPLGTKPRDPKAGFPIDLILQRLVGAAVIVLVGTTILTSRKVDRLADRQETIRTTYMTDTDGVMLQLDMRAELVEATAAATATQSQILQELVAIRTSLEAHVAIVHGDNGNDGS